VTAALIAALLLAPAPAKTRLVSIVWDGAADWVVDQMLANGELPNVARLVANGVHAKAVIPAWPSKTAVGHASLFTCAWPDTHGVANNSVGLLPRSEHGLGESQRGFDSRAVLAEPIWVSAAKSGRKVVALSAATSFPPAPYVEQIVKAGGNPKNFVEFSGFETELAPGKMLDVPANAQREPGKIEFATTIADEKVAITVFDDPKDSVNGFDTVRLANGAGWTADLKPKPANEQTDGWSPALKVSRDGHPANAYFRLWSLAPDSGKMELYQRKTSAILGTESDDETRKYVDAYGGFHDDPFFAYDRGTYGPTLYQGGNGEAERRTLELVAQDCTFLERSFAYGWKRWNPDFLLHYTPMSDSAGHQWMGALDPTCPGYDPAVADKLWPYYKRVYQLQDRWLGFILDHVGKDTVVALMSDHGMAGARWYAYVNNALEKAGLLVRENGGAIDWSKTKAAVPAWSDFFVVVNSTDRRGGIVFPSEREAVLKVARKALLDMRDPTSGEPIVTAVHTPEDATGMGIGGPAGGDLYFELAPGYYPSNRANPALVGPYANDIGGGVHGFFPYRRTMSAIFYAAGPGLAKGVELPVMRHVDVFPTLFRAAGLPTPKDAVGVAY